MSQKFKSQIDAEQGIKITNELYDGSAAAGSSGQVLSSTGSATQWIDFNSDTAERIQVTVKNVSGGSLSKGTVVHAAPTATPPSGNVIEVIAADANVAASMPAIGVLNETIADEAEGAAVMFGAVSGIDTSSFSIGDELYVSTTAGEFTATKPTANDELVQKVAIVIKSHASNGLIKVFGAGRANDVPNRVDRNMNFTDDSELTFGDSDDASIKYDSTATQLFISGESKFLNDVILSDGSLTVNEGNNLVKLSGGANSIGEIELKDGASVYLQGWGDSFKIAVNGDYTNRAFEIASDKSATFTGPVVGTSFSAPSGFINGSNGGIRIHTSGTKFFNITEANVARDNIMDIGAADARFKDLYLGGNISAGGNITTDGIFINDSAPDDEVVQFIQSGRKTALKTYFASSATGSYLDFRISNGNVDGSYSTPLRLYPDRVDITTAEIDTIKTNNIAKLTTGQPILINSGSDNASTALRVYYDMQVYNTISFTNASWSNQGRISGSSGILSLQGGSGTSTIFINSTDQVKIRNNADLGTNTRLGIAMDVSGNAANLDESTDYNAMSIAPYRVGSSYGMYFGGGHGSSSSAGFIQSAKVDGTDSSTISLNPFGGPVGINTGISDPSSTLHIQGSFRTHSTGTYPMGILNEFVSTYVSRTKFGNIGTSSNLEIYYDISGTEEARITRNYTASTLKFMRGTTTDVEFDGSGNVLIPGYAKYIKLGGYSYIGESLEDLHSLTIASDFTESIRFSHYVRPGGTYTNNMIINPDGDVLMGNTVINPASGFSNQKGFGYDKSTGNLQVASTSGTPMTIGRNESSAGEILELRKESTITHSFGTTDSYILSNVGILNNTPLARLTIGSSQGSSLDFSYDTTNGYRNNISNYWNSSTDTRMDFNIGRTANVAPVTVMSVGYNSNVGINTQTPDVDLQVTTAGTSSEDGIVKIGGSSDSLGLVLEYDQAGATFSYITANPTYTSDTSIMKIRVDGDRNINQLVLLGNGNIGMGRNDPNGNLEIITSSTVSGVSDTVNNVLIGLQSANRPTIILDTADTTYTNRTWNITNVGSAGSLFIGRNGLDVLEMQNNGDVRLGVDKWLKGFAVAGSTTQNLIRSRAMGYSGYYGLQIGEETNHIALFIDPGSVAGGSFNGNINEIMIPNQVVFEQANSAGNNWLYGQSISLYDGKLGLGIMTPSTKFHIEDGAGGGNPTDSRTKLYINSSGEAYISVNVPTNSYGGMRLAAAGTNKAFFELYDNTTAGQKLSLGTIDARDVVINTSNTERLRIDSNGNVNLLNTSSTNSRTFGITNANGTTGWTFGNGVIANSHQFVIYDNTAGDDRLLINSSGSVGVNCAPGNVQLKVLQTRSSEWAAGFTNTSSVGYGLFIDTGSSANTQYNFACYTNTGDGMALNGAGRLHIGNKTSFPSKLTVTSESSGLKAVEAYKPYAASQNIASFTNGNAFVRNSYDTFTIAQTDVACLVITETVNSSNQGTEQRLTLTVGDNKCVIGTSSTVTAGMYFNVTRSTSALGYQATNGITALHLTNDGYATFYSNIVVPANIYVGEYIYHKDDTNTYLRFTEDTFTFRTGGDDRAILNNNALNVGPHGTTSSTVNDGPLRVCNNSTGQANMGRGSVAVQLGPKTTRTATAGNFYGGITWNGLLNYGNNTTYDIAPHVWVGAKYKDFPGSERSSFVVGVKSGTGSTGSGNNIPVERLEIDYTGKMTVSGNILATGSITANGDVIAFSDKRLKENIKPIDNALKKITKLEGVSYNRIDIDDKSNKVGFIAQDVKKVLPEVVSDNEKYLGVNYGNITAVLVEAIKELKAEVDSLKEQLKNK